jgi:hypothetical protein
MKRAVFKSYRTAKIGAIKAFENNISILPISCTVSFFSLKALQGKETLETQTSHSGGVN